MLRLLLILCFATMPAFGQKGLSKRTRELFEGSTNEDTSTAKFILIRTGASMPIGGTKREDDATAGFLLEDNGPTFRAVLAALTICLCTKAGCDESDESYWGYRELSIEKEGECLVRELRDAEYLTGIFPITIDSNGTHKSSCWRGRVLNAGTIGLRNRS